MNKQEQVDLLNTLEIVDSFVGREEASWLVTESDDLKRLIESTGEDYNQYVKDHSYGEHVDIADLVFNVIDVDAFKNNKFIRYSEDEMRKLLRELYDENYELSAENERMSEQLKDIKTGAKALHSLIGEEEEDDLNCVFDLKNIARERL
jgi:hypothetical protein